MHEVDDELREIKREIIESRGLVIKTNNLTNALSADIKSIAKRQQGYERRLAWNSATAYVVFVVVVFAALKFAVDARVDAIEATSKHLRDENGRMKQDLDELRQRQADRQTAELEAAKFSDLVKQGKRLDLIKGWSRCATKRDEDRAQFLSDAVDKARASRRRSSTFRARELSVATVAGGGDGARGLAALRRDRRRRPAGKARARERLP